MRKFTSYFFSFFAVFAFFISFLVPSHIIGWVKYGKVEFGSDRRKEKRMKNSKNKRSNLPWKWKHHKLDSSNTQINDDKQKWYIHFISSSTRAPRRDFSSDFSFSFLLSYFQYDGDDESCFSQQLCDVGFFICPKWRWKTKNGLNVMSTMMTMLMENEMCCEALRGRTSSSGK